MTQGLDLAGNWLAEEQADNSPTGRRLAGREGGWWLEESMQNSEPGLLGESV